MQRLRHLPKHAEKHAEVQRVIDLTADPPTERFVINLTDAPFSPDMPAWPDGPPSNVVFTPPNDRHDLLPDVGRGRVGRGRVGRGRVGRGRAGRARHAAKHAKNRLAELRRWILPR